MPISYSECEHTDGLVGVDCFFLPLKFTSFTLRKFKLFTVKPQNNMFKRKNAHVLLGVAAVFRVWIVFLQSEIICPDIL